MGFKRSFGREESQELPSKQARLVDFSNKMTQFADLDRNASLKTDVTDNIEGTFVKPLKHEVFVYNRVSGASSLFKEFAFGAPLPFVTGSSIHADIGSQLIAYSSVSLEDSESDIAWNVETSEDACSSYLDSFPQKQVPLGPNHQANIPIWCKHVNEKRLELQGSLDPSNSSPSYSEQNVYNDEEEKLMGTCIIPLPDTEACVDDIDDVGAGRKDCSCMDEGSSRCVQQHIMEAREVLRKNIGDESLVNLGFNEMGEEVTNKWTKEEERVFHAVLNSNPASLGLNFWKQLQQVFSTRSTKEIVSYYFNVFMLRRRAAQNRSNLLDIDSDDDELHGIVRESYRTQVIQEDDNSDIESIDQYDRADHGEDTFVEDGEGDYEEDGDGDDDLGGDLSGEATGEDSGIDNVSETHDRKSFGGCRTHAVKHFDERARIVGEDFTVQDDSCMTFEFHPDRIESCNQVGTDVATQGRQVNSDDRECLPGDRDGYGDGVDQVYLLDACEAKTWDTCFAVSIKGVDLLSTCNIIEEIFGEETSIEKK